MIRLSSTHHINVLRMLAHIFAAEAYFVLDCIRDATHFRVNSDADGLWRVLVKVAGHRRIGLDERVHQSHARLLGDATVFVDELNSVAYII